MSRRAFVLMLAVELATLLPLKVLALPEAPATDHPQNLTLAAGTELRVTLTTALSSKTNETGDPFTAKVEDPIFEKGQEIIPAGSIVEGRVSLVKEPGRAKGVAEMKLTPEKIAVGDNVEYDISAGLQEASGAPTVKTVDEEGTLKGQGKSKKRTAEEAGIGGAAGAGIGGIADGGSGALIGLVAGGAAGLAHSVFKKHGQIVVPQGTELTFIINRATTAKRVTGSAPMRIETRD